MLRLILLFEILFSSEGEQASCHTAAVVVHLTLLLRVDFVILALVGLNWNSTSSESLALFEVPLGLGVLTLYN